MKMDILATFATSSSSSSSSSLLSIRSDIPSAPAPPFAWFLRGSFPGGCRTVPPPSGDPPWTGGWSRTSLQWGRTVSPSPTLGLLWSQMIRHVTSFILRLTNNFTTMWDDIWRAIGFFLHSFILLEVLSVCRSHQKRMFLNHIASQLFILDKYTSDYYDYKLLSGEIPSSLFPFHTWMINKRKHNKIEKNCYTWNSFRLMQSVHVRHYRHPGIFRQHESYSPTTNTTLTPLRSALSEKQPIIIQY